MQSPYKHFFNSLTTTYSTNTIWSYQSNILYSYLVFSFRFCYQIQKISMHLLAIKSTSITENNDFLNNCTQQNSYSRIYNIYLLLLIQYKYPEIHKSTQTSPITWFFSFFLLVAHLRHYSHQSQQLFFLEQ